MNTTDKLLDRLNVCLQTDEYRGPLVGEAKDILAKLGNELRGGGALPQAWTPGDWTPPPLGARMTRGEVEAVLQGNPVRVQGRPELLLGALASTAHHTLIRMEAVEAREQQVSAELATWQRKLEGWPTERLDELIRAHALVIAYLNAAGHLYDEDVRHIMRDRSKTRPQRLKEARAVLAAGQKRVTAALVAIEGFFNT